MMSKIEAIQKAAGNTPESRTMWWLSVKPFISKHMSRSRIKDILERAFGNEVSVKPDKITFLPQ